MSGLSVHNVQVTAKHAYSCTDLMRLSRLQTGGSYAVDMRFADDNRLFVVNEKGTLYQYQLSDGRAPL